MTTTVVRYGAHKALERLEWLERHVQARPDTPEVRKRVAEELEELERWLLKRVIGATVPPRKSGRKPLGTSPRPAGSVEDKGGNSGATPPVLEGK